MNDDEPDQQDETRCLYDDELNALLAEFAKGVRVLVFAYSCHSGTVVRLAYYRGTESARVKYRFMPPSVALRTYRANRTFYDPILKDKKLKESAEKVRATILLISGCQDNQLSADGDFNGLFTSQLLQVWKNGEFKGDYIGFHKAIVRRMPPDQTPNYFHVGAVDRKFEKQRPFTT